MSDPTSTRRFTYPGRPECEDCYELDSNATRTKARRHAESTGHTTRWTVENVTIFNPKG
jgi:hypothetical protein